MSSNEKDCAREILEVAPLVTASIRYEMRRNRASDLTVPQFRTLIFVKSHPGASLSEVAAHVGLSAPSMSRTVDVLVAGGQLRRSTDAKDRRRITLSVTARGQASLRRVRAAAQDFIAARVSSLSPSERTSVIRAMHTLRKVFAQASGAGPSSSEEAR